MTYTVAEAQKILAKGEEFKPGDFITYTNKEEALALMLSDNSKLPHPLPEEEIKNLFNR